MAAIPKFSEMSLAVQVAVIVAVGAGLWAVSEYVWPLPAIKAQVAERTGRKDQLESQNQPLRQYREKRNQLEIENKQLEAQLENLKRIVPNEKEVDNFVRQVQAEALSAGILVRRFTAKTVVQQEYYIEVPFEVEMDGPFYDVLQFYDRLGKIERIINVSELKMGGIEAQKSIGQKAYTYSPSETVVAICSVTTFFSKEGQEPVAGTPARPGAPARPHAPAPAPRR